MIRIGSFFEGAALRLEHVFFPPVFRNDPDTEFEISGISELLAADAELSMDNEKGIWTLRRSEKDYAPRIVWPAFPSEPGPVLLWHHASGEIPYTTPGPWGRINMFNRLFPGSRSPVPGYAAAYVQAPFHETQREFRLKAYSSASSTLKMTAASILMIEKSVSYLKAKGYGPVVVAGYSLGGVAAAWHMILFDTADVYIPIAASADFHSMLFSGFLPVGGDAGRKMNLACYKGAFDPSSGLKKDMAVKCFPLLGEQDELVPRERSRRVWDGFDVEWVHEGHFTLYMRHDTVWKHIQSHI